MYQPEPGVQEQSPSAEPGHRDEPSQMSEATSNSEVHGVHWSLVIQSAAAGPQVHLWSLSYHWLLSQLAHWPSLFMHLPLVHGQASAATSDSRETSAVLQSQPGRLHQVVGMVAPCLFVQVHMYQPEPGVQEQSPSEKPGHRDAPSQVSATTCSSSLETGSS